MSAVGEFPGINSMKRRMIRGPVNPLDKSTVISILPKLIEEVKHTIQPGRFIIQPGSFDAPSLLVVSPSSWWRDIDEEQPLLEIPVSSIQIADSVVKDYCNGILACNMGDSMPGLGYVPGEVKSIEELKKNYPTLLDVMLKKQRNWFTELVKLADMLWARSNGNPLTIGDDMRLACRELNLTSVKDWMKDFTMIAMERCFACGSLKNPQYPVCATCRAVDSKHPGAKDIKFSS